MENEDLKQGEDVQAAVEQKESQQDINWAKARESLAEQSQTIRALQTELERLKQIGKQPEEDDTDLITAKELKNALAEKDKSYNEQLLELKARAKYSDFEDILTKYGKKLPEAVRKAILRSEDPFSSAYEACKASAEYYKDKLSSTQHDYAKKIDENLNKPASASSVGGAGTVSKANIYKDMSLAEIRELANKRATG